MLTRRSFPTESPAGRGGAAPGLRLTLSSHRSLSVHLAVRRCESLRCVLRDVPAYSQVFSLELVSWDGPVQFHPKQSLLESLSTGIESNLRAGGGRRVPLAPPTRSAPPTGPRPAHASLPRAPPAVPEALWFLRRALASFSLTCSLGVRFYTLLQIVSWGFLYFIFSLSVARQQKTIEFL